MCWVCTHTAPPQIPYAHWIHIREHVEKTLDLLGDAYHDLKYKSMVSADDLNEAIRSLMLLQTYCLENVDE